jgi:hypothetical protein
MITLDHLAEQKTKYQELVEYYKKLGFDVLESKFTDVVKLIEEIEKYVGDNNEEVANCG